MGTGTTITTIILILLAIYYKNPLLECAIRVEDTLFPLTDFDDNSRYLDSLKRNLNGYKIPGLNDSLSQCNSSTQFGGKLGSGWNKDVYSLGNSAVKHPNLKGLTFHQCLQKNFGKRHKCNFCKIDALRGFINEIRMLDLLRSDPNVPKLYSYCIPTDFFDQFDDLEVRLQKGVPIDVVYLVNLDYRRRIGFIREVVDFVRRNSFLKFADFRRQQFIQIDDKPLYVDFDNVDLKAVDKKDSCLAAKIFDQFVKDFILIGAPSRDVPKIRKIFDCEKNSTLTISTLSSILSTL